MIIDTSAILAIFFAEHHGKWVIEQLSNSNENLLMSTVNLTETLIRIKDKQPKLFDDIENKLLNSDIRFIAPDVEQAQIATQARLEFPLNLGDCFAYALAKQKNQPILTLDTDFLALNWEIIIPANS
jgi:ribonuclease VapC